MSIYSTVARFVSAQRNRHARLRSAMTIANLPRGLQKDIGWPDGVDFDRDFRVRARCATERPQ